MFRFNYGAEFLLWALTPPGYFADWHVGVRATKSRALVACITGVPASVSVRAAAGRLCLVLRNAHRGFHQRATASTQHTQVHGAAPLRMCEINFLCVHKKLRAKRLAPVLIREVTRRVNLKGVFQAAYTAGVVLPRPVASARCVRGRAGGRG